MDNDSKIRKTCIDTYRRVFFNICYMHMNVKDESEGNKIIYDHIQSDRPVMIGRLGAVEMRCVYKWMRKKQYTQSERFQALYAAGIFPNNDDTLNQFCSLYTKSMSQCDILGLWNVTAEKRTIKMYCKHSILVASRAIEPYYHIHPWSEGLKDKKVLVIHPFIESIKHQINNRKNIWPEKNVLPGFSSVEYIKAVQSNAGEKTRFNNWFEAFEYMKEEIVNKDFDIALIGAGAYGFPLAAYIKSSGKQAVQMSGATQILFGIKGKRWDTHPIVSTFYNDAWIRPSLAETPSGAKMVEGGSYW